MKTLKSTAIMLGLFALLAGTTSLARAQGYEENYRNDGYSTGNISLQTFYDELSPYGTWIQDPQYGYVWRPDIDQQEFRPYYTNGRWVMTEYGNTWVSNYDWGWAPFHYGRWVINNYRQWIWLPDTNWGPAWVDWRSGDGYYGWAPMAPDISINLSFGRRYAVPDYCWNFIPQNNIYINRFPRYDYGRNNIYIRNTTIINNTYVYNRKSYYGGPRVEDIRRATNRDVRVYRFEQSSRPGAGRIDSRAVSIYRPRPERNTVDNRNAAPRTFEQGNAGFGRTGRNDNSYSNRGLINGNNNNNRFDRRNDNRISQPNRGDNNNTGNRSDNNNQTSIYNREENGRTERANRNFDDAAQRSRQVMERSQEQSNRNQQVQQQRATQMDQQRAQRDQQMQQRNDQVQQQRAAQAEQQRAQRDQQMQQRNDQVQQQRAEQQRAQRDQQMQQRNEQKMQQRQQHEQKNRGIERNSEAERPTRGGRG